MSITEIIEMWTGCCNDGGSGGGGETITWLLENATATVAYDSDKEEYGARFLFPESVTADNFEATFSGKSSVTVFNGNKVESPIKYTDGDPSYITIHYWETLYDEMSSAQSTSDELYLFFFSNNQHEGETVTLSLGIVED